MAPKKKPKLKKTVKKPAAKPKKVFKKPAAKKAPAKKPAEALKKPVKKPAKTLKRPTKPATVAKKPPKVIKKPKAVAAPKKAKPKKEPVNRYRRLRKWTIPKLQALIAEPAKVRTKLHIPPSPSPLKADELIRYLEHLENQVPEWKVRRDSPKKGKPGRRKKGEAASIPAPAPTAVVSPSTTLASAKSGAILPPRPNGAAKPPLSVPKLFKVPKLLQA